MKTHAQAQSAGIDILGNDNSPLQIYPNPMREKSVLTLFVPGSGNAVISILNLSGETISEISTLRREGRTTKFHHLLYN